MSLVLNDPWITGKVRCQNGYVYIDNASWNSEKQQSDHKRQYIGKYDGTTFTPNKTYYRLQEEYKQNLIAPKTGPVPTDVCLRQFHGATYLLDCISEKTGIAADLGKCFGSLASQILSTAYYLVVEEGVYQIVGRAVIARTNKGEVVFGVFKNCQKDPFNVLGLVDTFDNLIKENGGEKVIDVGVVVVESLPVTSTLLTKSRDVDVIKRFRLH